MAKNAEEKKTFVLNARCCKACGICMALCPKTALTPDEAGKPVMTKPEDCVHCSLCEMRCPDFAIRFE